MPPCLTELTRNQWIAFSKLGKEDPGMEIAFPYAGNLEIIQGGRQKSAGRRYGPSAVQNKNGLSSMGTAAKTGVENLF